MSAELAQKIEPGESDGTIRYSTMARDEIPSRGC